MRLTTTNLFLCVLLLASTQLLGAAEDKRDSITRRDGKTVRAYIQRETISELIYSSKKEGGSEQKISWKDVRRSEYNAMKGGIWTIPEQAMFDGDFQTAIKQYTGLAGLVIEDGSDEWTYKAGWDDVVEWKRAYGLYHRGLALEANGQRKEAAAAYGRVLDKLPEHRLAVDAAFRQAVNQALTGEDHSAAQKALKKYATDNASTRAGDLDKALGAIVLVGKDDMTKAKREAGRMRSRFRSSVADWIAWRELWGSILMEKKEYKEALKVYTEVFEKMSSNPKRRARAAFLLGKALEAAGEEEEAQLHFMRLDALPLVGKADLAYARYRAAVIYLKRIDTYEGPNQVRVKDLCKELLKGVVRYGPGDSDLILEAQTIIDEQLTAKPVEVEDAEAEEGEAKDEAAEKPAE